MKVGGIQQSPHTYALALYMWYQGNIANGGVVTGNIRCVDAPSQDYIYDPDAAPPTNGAEPPPTATNGKSWGDLGGTYTNDNPIVT